MSQLELNAGGQALASAGSHARSSLLASALELAAFRWRIGGRAC